MDRTGCQTLLGLALLAAVLPCHLVAGGGADCELAWTVVPGADASAEGSALSALAVLADDDIWAAGSTRVGESRHTLAQRWDGDRWTIVPSPDGPKQVNRVTGVAAVANDDAWMVGYSTDRDVGETLSETLIQRWDGQAWKLVSSPNLKVEDVSEELGGHPVSNEIYAVAAASKDDVWAVGRSHTFTQGQELIVHWDGAVWSVVPSPHPGVSAWLRGVAVVSSTDVWAFGEYYAEVILGGEEGGGGSLQQNLIEHWDGSAWSVVPSPNLGPAVNGLFRGSVVAADDIWVVGYHLEVFRNQINHPTVLRWDGGAWNVVPVAVHNRETTYLFAISAFAADEVFAVGFYDTGPPFPTYRTLIERWDGVRWDFMASADPGDINYLYAVAAVFQDDVWAVGEEVRGELFTGPLIERYTSSCTGGSFVRGDANADGTVDISDAVAALGYLFLGVETLPCLDAADADDSGELEITDAIFVLGFLFQGAESIPPPYPDPGADPTANDALDCRSAG